MFGLSRNMYQISQFRIGKVILEVPGQIWILPGAGITMRNIRRVANETGAKQLHVAVHRSFIDASTANNRSIYYGGCLYPPEDRYNIIDGAAVGTMIRCITARWKRTSPCDAYYSLYNPQNQKIHHSEKVVHYLEHGSFYIAETVYWYDVSFYCFTFYGLVGHLIVPIRAYSG